MARTQGDRRAETRALLISAAADLFARKGFHAVSAEAVAAAADRTTGALYDHFGGKEGLLLALLDVWMEQTTADLTAELYKIPDLDGLLAALWEGIVHPDEARSDSWVLLEFELWLHGVRDPQIGAPLADRYRIARSGLAGGLEQWSKAFDFTLPGPSEDVAIHVLALLLGAAFQHRLDPAVVAKAVVVAGLRRLLGITDGPAGGATGGAAERPSEPHHAHDEAAEPGRSSQPGKEDLTWP